MSSLSAEKNGYNFLHALAAVGQAKLASKVISTTPKKIIIASLNARDKLGRTPLHLAAYFGHLKVLKIFQENSSEAADIRDNNGNSVRDALRRPEAAVLGDPEVQKYFMRLVKIEKLGHEHQDFGQGPMDVWDVALSSNSMVIVAQPTWSDQSGDTPARMLYSLMKGNLQRLDLGPDNVPRYVATSNIHTLALTANKCFAWGKNINGVLGIDADEKIITEPTEIEERFVESSQGDHMNAFSALGGANSSNREFKDPLIGVDCCDFHSLCHTTTKIWAWGVNRGQMLAKAFKNSIVDTPLLVYQSSTVIRSVKCCDDAIVILLSNGQVHILHQDIRTQLSAKSASVVEAIATSSDYIVVQNNLGKLLRFSLKALAAGREDYVTLWTPRRNKDEVLSFDLGDNGNVIVATQSSVFRVDDGREVVEFKMLMGMPLSSIKADPQFRSFVGVSSLQAGFDYILAHLPALNRYDNDCRYIRWGSFEPKQDHQRVDNGDLTLIADNTESIAVHASVLYARCPSLRGLIKLALSGTMSDGEPKPVASPGGSAIFTFDGGTLKTIRVEHAPLDSVKSFVHSLYFSYEELDQSFTQHLGTGRSLHEYNALKAMITKDLGPGLWDARSASVGCDIKLRSGRVQAHSAVLSSASPVLAAQISRWRRPDDLDDPALTKETIDDVLRYMYTMELPASSQQGTELEIAERIFELWAIADELLMPNLSNDCEQRLFEMLNFNLIVPFLRVTSSSQGTSTSRLHYSLLDIIVRYMSYFFSFISDLELDSVDAIERHFKKTAGTYPVDTDLAESFERLRQQSAASVATPKSKKSKGSSNNSNGSSSRSTPVANEANATSSLGSLAAVSPSPTHHAPELRSSPSNLWNSQGSVSAMAASKGEKYPLDQQVKGLKVSEPGSGWIQSGRKPRTSFSTGAIKREDVLPTLGSKPQGSAAVSPVQASRSVTPVRGASAPSMASPAPSSASPSSSFAASPSALPTLSQVMRASASSSAQISASASASSSPQAVSKLDQLPKLGESLPTLGSKPRTTSAAKGSRPKFNGKGRKVQQFDNPLSFAKTFSPTASSSGSSSNVNAGGTPWKQVPKVVETSQSVLQSLERAQQINSRKYSGGNVWGL